MNASDTSARRAGSAGPIIVTLLCFIVLMPPLGLLTSLLLEMLAPDFAELPFFMPPGMGMQNPLTILMSLTAVIIFYAALGMQALLCGVAMAALGRLRGSASLLVVLVAAAITFAAANVLMWRELPGTIPTMLLVHVIPATICWFITRRLWQEV